MKTVEEINEEIRELKESGQSVKDISDTLHTFRQCYGLRDTYFEELGYAYPKYSWKSKKHFDEVNDPISSFNGCFIMGINTPKGPITRHVKLEHWDEIEFTEIEHAPKYDGYDDVGEKERVKSLRLLRKKED